MNDRTIPHCRLAALVPVLFWSTAAVAGDAPSQCTDLDAIDPVPAVDFQRDIEPIFSAGCTACHGEGGAAGLDLRPGRAYGNLVGVEATTNPDRIRVQPFAPDASLLLSAINCAVTGGPSFQMPGTEPAQRALIRDWIAQGARAQPEAHPVPATGLPALLLLLALVAGLGGVGLGQASSRAG